MNKQEREHIYLCPRCEVDTLHTVISRKNDLLGIACTNCQTPSLVRLETLTYHQLKWEDELRQILDSLEKPFDET